MYIDTPEVKAIVARAFPAYNGRKFQVLPFQGPMNLASYWSGGSRDYFCGVQLADGKTSPVPENGTPWNPAVNDLSELPPNVALVMHHAGPNEYVAVYVRPENLNQLALPAPADLSRDEKIVLTATRSFKSSYAGRSNNRFYEAHGTTGIALEQWEAAKAGCIAKGYLNKAGAITDAGRNAVPFDSCRIEHFKPVVHCTPEIAAHFGLDRLPASLVQITDAA